MKKSELISAASLVFVLIAFLSSQHAFGLGLNEYLQTVQQQSVGYSATTEQARAAYLKSREADLVFTPKLFGNARTGHDGKPTFASTITYDRLDLQNYSLGVSQDFSFGLQTKLSYEIDRTEVIGATLPAGTPNSFWTAAPTLEVALPLWGNAFGRKTFAESEITRQQNLSEQKGAEAQSLSYLVEAESAYWKLATAQEVVQVQERAFKQAQDILNYLTKKSRMNLAENADVLQAKAMVAATTFQLQVAKNQMKAAQRSFNVYINQAAETPTPALDPVNYGYLENIVVPTSRPGDRLDIKAAEAQMDLAKASSKLAAEKNKPTVDLYGSYAMNGQEEKLNDALKSAGYATRDTAFVGVRLNVPLNFSASHDARAGAVKAEHAAESAYQYKTFTQAQDWTNLTQQMSEAKENLRLTNNVVSAQSAKLQNERTRLRQGRTTTYQVLLFEQDFSQSELNRVQVAAQILGLQSQIKLYQASSDQEGK